MARQAKDSGAFPFLKWAGGKRQLLTEIHKYLPTDLAKGTYHEPFLGGGAVFFDLLPDRPVLSDGNARLMRAYTGIRDDVEAVIALLKDYPHDKSFFLQLRDRDIDRGTDAEVAAWLVYLNRTAFNGLYRVNSRNVFNVPFGDYANPTICDAKNLRACSAALQRADLRCVGFERVVERARRGDFVYFDPPYLPLSVTSSFTSYTKDGFGIEQHRVLRDVARALLEQGVRVLLSNSAAPAIVELYSEDPGLFVIHRVQAARAVNSKAEGRGKIEELLIEGVAPTSTTRRRKSPRA